jgi:tellurite resistance protein TehA-like permease
VFLTGLVLTVTYGGWLSGQWIIGDLRLDQWHAGYLLPTVAGGLVAAAGSATLGYVTLAPGWWAFSFSYAAAFTFAMCWAALAPPGNSRTSVEIGLLSAVTLGIAALAVRSAIGLVDGTCLPRASLAAGSPGISDGTESRHSATIRDVKRAWSSP